MARYDTRYRHGVDNTIQAGHYDFRESSFDINNTIYTLLVGSSTLLYTIVHQNNTIYGIIRGCI